VVEVDATFIIPALGEVGTVTQYPDELHDGREAAKGVEGHAYKEKALPELDRAF
jgi:hypothetical protein